MALCDGHTDTHTNGATRGGHRDMPPPSPSAISLHIRPTVSPAAAKHPLVLLMGVQVISGR